MDLVPVLLTRISAGVSAGKIRNNVVIKLIGCVQLFDKAASGSVEILENIVTACSHIFPI